MATMNRTAPVALVGMDTFRGGEAGSTLFRTQLYDKTNKETTTDRSGITRTASPISGNLLISSASASKDLKDPIAGTTLRRQGGKATVTAPVQKQQFLNSRKFYLTRDVDVTIQT